MQNGLDDHRISRPQWWEGLAVAFGLQALLLLTLWLNSGIWLYQRPMWLDEVFSQTIVGDPSLAHSMHAIASGVDTNPPTMHLIMRLLCPLLGGVTPLSMRLLSTACVVLAVAVTYQLCRRVTRPLPALVGVLVIWTHPKVVWHLFEARFYGFWLAAMALFCLALVRRWEHPRQWSSAFALAAASVLLCCIHYLAVLSVALVIVGVLAVQLLRPLPFRQIVQRLLPVAWGVGALGIIVAIFLKGQKTGLTISTWIPKPDRKAVIAIFSDMYNVPSVELVAVAAGCWAIFTLLRGRSLPARWFGKAFGQFAAPLSLLAFPLVLVIFSYAVQPALVGRYAIVTTVGLAVLAALLAEQLPAALNIVLAALLLVSGWGSAIGVLGARLDEAHTQEGLIADIRYRLPGQLILFERQHEFYPLCMAAPDLAPHCRELVTYDPAVQYSPAVTFERDCAVRLAKIYPLFATASAPRPQPGLVLGLVMTPRFVPVVASLFPGATIRQLHEKLFEVRWPDTTRGWAAAETRQAHQ